MIVSTMFKQQKSVPIVPTQVIYHSLANGYNWVDGVGWLVDPANPLEAHYAVRKDGYAVQLVDDTMRAEANYHANKRPDGTGAISIETDSDKFGLDLWTEEQLDALVELTVMKCRKFDIPARLCRTPSDPGLGWHIMWGSPGEWTPVAKACPGPGRIVQVRSQILPRVQKSVGTVVIPVPKPNIPATPAPAPTDWFDMATKEDLVSALQDPRVVNAIAKRTVTLLLSGEREAVFAVEGGNTTIAGAVSDLLKARVSEDGVAGEVLSKAFAVTNPDGSFQGNANVQGALSDLLNARRPGN